VVANCGCWSSWGIPGTIVHKWRSCMIITSQPTLALAALGSERYTTSRYDTRRDTKFTVGCVLRHTLHWLQWYNNDKRVSLALHGLHLPDEISVLGSKYKKTKTVELFNGFKWTLLSIIEETNKRLYIQMKWRPNEAGSQAGWCWRISVLTLTRQRYCWRHVVLHNQEAQISIARARWKQNGIHIVI